LLKGDTVIVTNEGSLST